MSGASVDVVLGCQIQILNPNGSIFQIPTRCGEDAGAAGGEGPGGAEAPKVLGAEGAKAARPV